MKSGTDPSFKKQAPSGFSIIMELDQEDVSEDIYPYLKIVQPSISEADEHQYAQAYWTERGVHRSTAVQLAR